MEPEGNYHRLRVPHTKKKVILVNQSQKKNAHQKKHAKNSPNFKFPQKKKSCQRWPTVKERSQSPHINTSTVLQIPVATYRASCSKSFIEVISANTAAKAPPWNVGTGNRKAPCSSRTDRIFFLPTIRFGSVTCTEESKIKMLGTTVKRALCTGGTPRKNT